MASLVADLYKELRRLSIAGGELGAGDFRLAKILPQLKGAAEKAPVFGKLAAGLEKITAPETADRLAAILETAALARAVMCVQAKPEPAPGELTALPETGLDTSIDQFSYRVIEPIKEALTVKGSGRRREALGEGLKNGASADLRLLDELLKAIDNPDGTISYLAGQALEKIGRPAVPGLLAAFDPKSKRSSNSERLEVLGHILGPEGQSIYARAWAEGSVPVRCRALEFLALSPENDPIVLEALAAEAPPLTEAAAFGLVKAGRLEMAAHLAETAADLLGRLRSDDFSQRLPDQPNVRKVTQDKARQFLRFLIFLSALARLEQPRALELGRAALAVEAWRNFDLTDLATLPGVYLPDFMQLDRQGTVHGFCLKAISGYDPAAVLAEIRAGLAVPEPDAGLVQAGAAYAFKALGPAEFYELFRPVLKTGRANRPPDTNEYNQLYHPRLEKGQTQAENCLLGLLPRLADFGSPDGPVKDPAARRPLDTRWARAAAELDLTPLAVYLAEPGMTEVAEYFDKKLAEALKKPGLGHNRFHSAAYLPLMGLAKLGHQPSIDMFIKALKEDYFLAAFKNIQSGQKDKLDSPGPTADLMSLVPRASFELLLELQRQPRSRDMKGQAALADFINTFRLYVLGEEAETLDWKALETPVV